MSQEKEKEKEKEKEMNSILVKKDEKPPFLLKLSKAMGWGAIGLAVATAVLAPFAAFFAPVLVPAVILGMGALTIGLTAKAMENTYKERMKSGFYGSLSSEDLENDEPYKASKEEKKEDDNKGKTAFKSRNSNNYDNGLNEHDKAEKLDNEFEKNKLKYGNKTEEAYNSDVDNNNEDTQNAKQMKELKEKEEAAKKQNNDAKKPAAEDEKGLSAWVKNKKTIGPFTRYLVWGSAATTAILIGSALLATGLGLPMAVPIAAYVLSNVYFSFKLYTKLPVRVQRSWENKEPKKTAPKKSPAHTYHSSGRNKNYETTKIREIDKGLKNADAFYNEKFLKKLEHDEDKKLGLKETIEKWINKSNHVFSEKEREAFKVGPFKEAFNQLSTKKKDLVIDRYSEYEENMVHKKESKRPLNMEPNSTRNPSKDLQIQSY